MKTLRLDLKPVTHLGWGLLISKDVLNVFSFLFHIRIIIFLFRRSFICWQDLLWSQHTVLEVKNSLAFFFVPIEKQEKKDNTYILKLIFLNTLLTGTSIKYAWTDHTIHSYLSWCSAIEKRFPLENLFMPSSPAFAFSVDNVRTTSMTSHLVSFLICKIKLV